jgi:hypothetical protein
MTIMPFGQRRPGRALLCNALLLAGATVAAPSARGQAIEPRAYSNAPVGVNFLILSPVYASGGLSIDPALPLRKPDLETSSVALAFARFIELWGQAGKFDVIVPYSWLEGSATLYDEAVTRKVHGFADPAFRLSVNFYGAPALTAKEFASYRQDLIVGASLMVMAPLGQYDDARLVNLGSNRWSIRPGLGVSKALGRWTVEGSAAVTLYTDNDDFVGDRTRSQDPLYSLQWNTICSFAGGRWASLDVNYYTGGSSTLDGVAKRDLQRNWRAGLTVALPVDRRNSIKLYASRGVSARTGNNFDLAGIAWQYRWGGGL